MITLPRIISQALQDPAVLASLGPSLCSTLTVPNPFERQIAEFAVKFWSEYGALPQSGDWEIWLDSLNENIRVGVSQKLNEIRSLPKEQWTPEYVVKEVAAALRTVAVRNAVARLNTMAPNIPPDALAIIADEVKKVEPVSIHGLKDLKDVHQYIYSAPEDDVKMWTGIRGIDRLIGGFRPELTFVLADSSVGKTTALLNFGASSALRGARILHLTFELSAENTLRRYYRNIAQVTGYEVRDDPARVVGMVGRWLRFAKGWVHVLYLPAYTVGASEFDSLLDQYVQIYGGVDGIILDYLDLMKPELARDNEYNGLGKLSHYVRNTAVGHNAAALSATQATRGAHQVRHLRLDHMGDSYQKVRAADNIIGLVQTPEEYEAQQGRAALLKIRENPGRGVEVPLLINMDRMLITDLDNADSRRIAELAKLSTTSVFVEE